MPLVIFYIFFNRSKEVNEPLEISLFFTLFIGFKKPMIFSHSKLLNEPVPNDNSQEVTPEEVKQ